MCLFKNEFRTQKLTRTISDGTYTRNLHIRRRISSRRAPSLMVVPSDCAMLLRSRRTKDGGIIREMSLSMRVPIVSPTNDVFFCRELPLFEWWEKSPEGKEGAI